MRVFKARVSASYRNQIQLQLNLPDEDYSNWKLLEYILFYPEEDRDDNHQFVIHHKTVQAICNSTKSAGELMRAFEDATGIILNITPYTTYGSKARTIQPIIPNNIKSLTNVEHNIPNGKKIDPVFFSSGEHIKAYMERLENETYLQDIMKKEFSPEHPLYDVIQYLHDHKRLIWTKKRVQVVAPQVYEYIAEMPEEDERLRCSRIWHFIEQYSSIEYDYVSNTRRIYSCNSNLITINRQIRELVFSNCFHLDLKAAHLGIVAKLWNLPLVTDFLSKGGNIWTELFSHCGISKSEDNKYLLKRCLYAVLYGKARTGNGKKPNLTKFTDGILGKLAASKFRSHYLIRELLTHRDIALQSIKANGGTLDGFNSFISLNSTSKSNISSQAKSVLSSTVQSYEVKLMLTAFSVIQANPDLLLTAWIHDGIYVATTHHKERAERYIAEIQSAVQTVIDELGFITELERNPNFPITKK